MTIENLSNISSDKLYVKVSVQFAPTISPQRPWAVQGRWIAIDHVMIKLTLIITQHIQQRIVPIRMYLLLNPYQLYIKLQLIMFIGISFKYNVRTQLFMKFARMIAQVGSFDRSMPNGGIPPCELLFMAIFLFSTTLGSSTIPSLMWRYSSLEILDWLSGFLVMKVSHKESQINPADANATKGVLTPKRDAKRVGVNIRPATLPKWKPAMVIPTALDLSVRGNHLQSAFLWGQTSMCRPFQRKK